MELSFSTLDYLSQNDMVEARLWLSEKELKLVKDMGLHKTPIFVSHSLQSMDNITVQQLLYSSLRFMVNKGETASQVIDRLIFIKDTLNTMLKSRQSHDVKFCCVKNGI